MPCILQRRTLCLTAHTHAHTHTLTHAHTTPTHTLSGRNGITVPKATREATAVWMPYLRVLILRVTIVFEFHTYWMSPFSCRCTLPSVVPREAISKNPIFAFRDPNFFIFVKFSLNWPNDRLAPSPPPAVCGKSWIHPGYTDHIQFVSCKASLFGTTVTVTSITSIETIISYLTSCGRSRL